MSFAPSTLLLQTMPEDISLEDRQKLEFVAFHGLEARVKLFEELIAVYGRHPFLLVRLADCLAGFQAGSIALHLYRETQASLLKVGVVDTTLDKLIQMHGDFLDAIVVQDLEESQKRSYYQNWKPTRQHAFPTNLPQSPAGHEELKAQWSALTASDGSAFLGDYLLKLIIETNDLESTFLITEASARDLIRRGLVEGVVHCAPGSALQDPLKIKSILNDTLAACNLLLTLVNNPDAFNPRTLSDIHACLMKTCRFTDGRYISAGTTRTTTRKTVVVSGVYTIQCCPFPSVDEELEYICKMAKQWTKSWRNSFATASWIHLVLVRCHPFEDGNGRLTRLIASIPLMKYGYPPISIGLTQQADYYRAINKAYDGDHSALSECILQGMRETMTSVQIAKAS